MTASFVLTMPAKIQIVHSVLWQIFFSHGTLNATIEHDNIKASLGIKEDSETGFCYKKSRVGLNQRDYSLKVTFKLLFSDA